MLGMAALAHGVYQFFAAALGFSLIFHPVGYYVLASGGFGEALGESFYIRLIPFRS